MGLTAFPNGVSSFGVPVVGSGPSIPASTGTYFFVDSSTGSNSNSGRDKDHPVATITYALTLCTASKGDVIVVMPGYTETVTAAITLSKAGVYVIGLGWGNLRPTITGNFAGDAMTITAANVVVDNIRFAGPSTDAQTADINVAAAGVTLRNLEMIGSVGSQNVVDCITLASGADDCTIENVYVYNTTVAVNSFLSIEAAVARLKVLNCFFFGDIVTAGISDGAAATQIYLANTVVGTVGTTIPGCILDSNPTGVVNNVAWLGTHTTIASNAQTGNAIRLKESYVLEATDGSVQATDIIPAKDTE
jgi:hypothetical protein